LTWSKADDRETGSFEYLHRPYHDRSRQGRQPDLSQPSDRDFTSESQVLPGREKR